MTSTTFSPADALILSSGRYLTPWKALHAVFVFTLRRNIFFSYQYKEYMIKLNCEVYYYYYYYALKPTEKYI